MTINGIEITSADGKYTLSQGKNTVTVSAAGSATTGYCIVKFGGNTYHTIQIFKVPAEGKPQSVTFTVNATAGAKLEIIPQWGTYAKPDSETLIDANSEIGTASETQSQVNNETGTVSTFKAENNAGNSETEETPQTSNVSSAEVQEGATSKTESGEETVSSDTQTATEPSSPASNVVSSVAENTSTKTQDP